jgi:hypothetical protein
MPPTLLAKAEAEKMSTTRTSGVNGGVEALSQVVKTICPT